MDILQYTFFQNALIGALLASILCGFVGTYIVTRRLVFISGGITHASFGGIGIGVFAGINPILSAMVFAILSAFGVQWVSRKKDVRKDSAIAMFWTLGMSVGIICCFLTPGFMPDLPSFLFGSTAANTDTPAAPTQTGSLEGTTLKVGASPAPHAEILAVVKELLAEEGINLEIVEFTDYIQPNTAVENGSIDANYFQHITYLNNFNAENGTHLVSVADVHYEPFGIYAGKTASLEELQDGAQIGVPNDPTNGGRALLLLQEQGLITLKEDVGLEPTKLDIAENPHNYEIVEMEAAQLPRSLGSLDIAVINGNYAIQADLKVADALAIESAEGTAGTAYVNVLAVKEGRESDPAIQALAKALCSDEVKAFIDETYAGAVQAVF